VTTRFELMSAQERYDDMKANHVAGRPVNAATYSNHGCRCAGCSQANTDRVVRFLHTHPESAERKRRYNRYERPPRVRGAR
jgi:hypothetical protein